MILLNNVLDSVKEACRAPNIDVSEFNGKGDLIKDYLKRFPFRIVLHDISKACVEERLNIGEERYNNPLRATLDNENWPREMDYDILQEVADALVYTIHKWSSGKNRNISQSELFDWERVAAKLDDVLVDIVSIINR